MHYQQPIRPNPPPPQMIGTLIGLREQMKVVEVVAPRETSVLIMGETGTGKEMLAREIHARSWRSSGPFVPLDCTTLVGSLLESQLFGHERGAFTGAVTEGLGLIRCAHGGTLFLDEIGEMNLGLQAKLLRVLQDHMVRPVGSAKLIPVDFRLITATNKDLQAMLRKREFREDLYYRLAVVCIDLPPLRSRPEDIIPLANQSLDALPAFYGEERKSLTRQASNLLKAYHWPGNVRELANVMERAYVLASGRRIGSDALTAFVRQATNKIPPSTVQSLAEAECEAILAALRSAHSVRTRAAALLDVDPRRLDRLMSRLGIAS